ncbi:hypothetical protein I656_00297 [Geobacillus sp. WSUCF1]|nr:hypothetical protein I656_00297 [Geobacillus sp. WSUCF1]
MTKIIPRFGRFHYNNHINDSFGRETDGTNIENHKRVV